MKHILMTLGLGVSLAGALSAQETPKFAFNVGAGFTTPVGSTGTQLNTGWNLDAGVGYNFHPRIGALVQFNDSQFDINAATLNSLGFPGGNVNLWSLTLDPIVHVHPRGPTDVYFIGGGGLYHWRQEFTQPTVAIFQGFDPFFGFFNTAIPAENVLTSYSVNKPGVNGGMGVAFGTRWNAKVYAEARYHRVIFGNFHADMVPVTFGIRW
jgi:outer membrane protein with beta-barrel domain